MASPNHLKRLVMPRSWPLPRKTSVWVSKPKPGAHSLERGMPLNMIIRDVLGLANTNREVRAILNQGLVKVDGRGFLERIVEKPDRQTVEAMGSPALVSMNCWRFGPILLQASKIVGPSARGELEITDAVQYAVDVLKEPFRVFTIRAPVLDLTSRQDVAAVAAKLADREVRL